MNVLIRDRIDRERRRKSCDDRGRDGSDMPISQEHQEFLTAWHRFSLRASCKEPIPKHLDFRPLPPRTARQWISINSSHQVCGDFYDNGRNQT